MANHILSLMVGYGRLLSCFFPLKSSPKPPFLHITFILFTYFSDFPISIFFLKKSLLTKKSERSYGFTHFQILISYCHSFICHIIYLLQFSPFQNCTGTIFYIQFTVNTRNIFLYRHKSHMQFIRYFCIFIPFCN